MIAEIDKARRQHNGALSSAMLSLSTLRSLIHIDGADVIAAAYLDAITAIDEASSAAIESIAQLEHAEGDAKASITVQGDYIKVGDINDGENIAIGKDINQEQKKT